MSALQIRDFEPADSTAFRVLNEAWISKYFSLEELDCLVLNDPIGHILLPGGKILIAYLGDEVVGCCALIPVTPGVFELGKMAVVECRRGQGIGRKILERTIECAKEIGATALHLASSKKLPDALHLYLSVGFRHTPPELVVPSPYARADVYMDLQLSAADLHCLK